MSTHRSTGIEWTEHTWNPFVGCTVHSAGCRRCYAMAQALRITRLGTTKVYDGTVREVNGRAVWTGTINRASDATWRKPYKVKTPSMFFVNSMSDFFHPNAPDEWRTEAIGIMRETPHQYQILTKHPEEIEEYCDRTGTRFPGNVWIGATVESGKYLERIEVLRQVSARIRFLSIEPLIGAPGELELSGIDWVIGGGESGRGARRMDPQWIRAVRDACIAQRVPFFFKQWGQSANNPLGDRAGELDPIGKGGSLLDGRAWKEWPAQAWPTGPRRCSAEKLIRTSNGGAAVLQCCRDTEHDGKHRQSGREW